MPKKSKLDIDRFIQIASQYNLRYTDSTTLKGPADSCWLGISRDLDFSITSKYAYTIVKGNRYGMAEKLFVNTSKINDNISPEAYENDEQQTNTSGSEMSENSDEKFNFNITLSLNEWNNLYDGQPQIYKRSDGKIDYRSFHTLKPYNWTSVIHDHFFEQTKLSCAMQYKYAKIYPDGQQFLSILGICSICKSVFKGILDNCPDTDKRVIIKCSITGMFKNCRSNKKRRIIGEKKMNILKN